MKAPSTQGHYNTHAEGGGDYFRHLRSCFFDQLGKLQLGNAIHVLTECNFAKDTSCGIPL